MSVFDSDNGNLRRLNFFKIQKSLAFSKISNWKSFVCGLNIDGQNATSTYQFTVCLIMWFSQPVESRWQYLKWIITTTTTFVMKNADRLTKWSRKILNIAVNSQKESPNHLENRSNDNEHLISLGAKTIE